MVRFSWVLVGVVLASGCATTLATFGTLETDTKHPEPASCGDAVGPMLGGVTLDAVTSGIAIATGETFSGGDIVITSLAAIDVVVATVITVKHCVQ